MITVAIPVGPEKHHCAYLDEALMSLARQKMPPHLVLLVDDMHDIDPQRLDDYRNELEIRAVSNPWRLGVASSFNVGVALAPTPYTLMMGADDVLDPLAIDRAYSAIRSRGRDPKEDRAFYWFGVRHIGDAEGEQYVPCNAAVVSRALWQRTGGFAPETGVGAPDAAFVSTLMTHPSDTGDLVPIDGGSPLYLARGHRRQDTRQRYGLHNAIIETRHWLDETWEPTRWGRYE